MLIALLNLGIFGSKSGIFLAERVYLRHIVTQDIFQGSYLVLKLLYTLRALLLLGIKLLKEFFDLALRCGILGYERVVDKELRLVFILRILRIKCLILIGELLSERMTLAEKLNVTGVSLVALKKNGKVEKNVTKARQLETKTNRRLREANLQD